jgi:type I restriction enzyme M protein
MVPLEIKYQKIEKRTRSFKKKANGPEPKLEAPVWAEANKLRGHVDAAEKKHVLLGLVFLTYISHAFDAYHRNLQGLKKWTSR